MLAARNFVQDARRGDCGIGTNCRTSKRSLPNDYRDLHMRPLGNGKGIAFALVVGMKVYQMMTESIWHSHALNSSYSFECIADREAVDGKVLEQVGR